MKKIILATCLSLIILIGNAWSQNFPAKPNKLVNDFTNTLSSEQQQALEQKLVAFNDSSSNQITVVIIQNLDGSDVADYANRLAESWGIGQKQKDNGILFLISKEDRKIRIEVGYGLEGVVPDALSKRIIENDVKPAFKQGDFYGGIDAGTTSLIKLTKGEYDAEPQKSKEGSPIGFIIIVILIILFIFISKNGGGGNRVIGGGALPWWMLMTMGGGNHRGSFGGFSGGGGGGGGGFGGFGGGGFGGGGSSGSW